MAADVTTRAAPVVQWHHRDRLPRQAIELLAAFDLVACEPGTQLEIEVSPHRLPERYGGLGLRPPTKGALAGLPLNDLVAFDDFDGLLLWSWRGGGLLAARRHSGHATFHPGPDASQTMWMSGQLTGTILALLGVLTPIHATAIRWEGRTLLILGESGSGKTTLSLLLVGLGARILAEDFVYMDRHGAIVPRTIREHLTIRRGTWMAMGPALADLWDAVPHWPGNLSPREAFESGRRDQSRLSLEPVLATPLEVMCPIDHVLLPSINPERSGVAVQAASTDLALERARAVDPRMLAWPTEFLAADLVRTTLSPSVGGCPAWSVQLGLDYGGERLGETQREIRTWFDSISGATAPDKHIMKESVRDVATL